MTASQQDFQATRPGASGASQNVRDDIDSLRSDIASLANSVGRLASDRLGTVASDAQDAAQQRLGDVEQAIRRNPTQSALLAAGIGFVVGLILTR